VSAKPPRRGTHLKARHRCCSSAVRIFIPLTKGGVAVLCAGVCRAHDCRQRQAKPRINAESPFLYRRVAEICCSLIPWAKTNLIRRSQKPR
jgi:hypothetical protein